MFMLGLVRSELEDNRGWRNWKGHVTFIGKGKGLFKKEGYTLKFFYVLKVWCFEYCSQLVKGLWPFWVPFTRAII